jgi:hypothetical protein
MLHPQPCCDTDPSTLSIRNRIDNLAATVRTISAGKKLRVRGLSRGTINDDAPTFQPNLRAMTLRL